MLTLMSLFDGSGGFSLAAELCGIEPISASEIEPFPILVTTKRFPKMQHYGDITQIDGSKVPPVDIITAGFPCQDLSVAGGRAGFEGKRSALFYHIPRIVKEMLAATDNTYPRYVVLENVPGLFSSAKGLDFQEVLNQLVKIKDETLSVPLPEKGKWSTSGEIMADDFSVAWRTLDAQYFGVPQRRRRIFLVADFGSGRAGEVLFEREGVPRDFEADAGARQGTAGNAENCAGTANDNITCYTAVIIENHPQDSRCKISADGLVQTLPSNMGTGGNNVPLIMDTDYDRLADAEEPYHVRRLTPLECGRLQGFPDWWRDNLETPHPTEEEILWWAEVFETHRKIIGTSTKPKSRKQIIKWLKNPHSDAVEYKMWGNGIALPCAVFVLNRIKQLKKGG